MIAAALPSPLHERPMNGHLSPASSRLGYTSETGPKADFKDPNAMSKLFMTATFLLMAATVVAGTLVSLLLS